jgi:hypothetical protein
MGYAIFIFFLTALPKKRGPVLLVPLVCLCPTCLVGPVLLVPLVCLCPTCLVGQTCRTKTNQINNKNHNTTLKTKQMSNTDSTKTSGMNTGVRER